MLKNMIGLPIKDPIIRSTITLPTTTVLTTIIILPIIIGIIITGGVAVHLRTLFTIIPQLFINVYRL
ncbi:hypothetical protein KsCSTR_44230 [Candidatus Kuenenia stuttgartiensis]|uniref:Uncharacterized protein n=1 Tax=Kuenenia stuttgartiensis TaxID=174633 RepID=A0A2C9CHA4_KUEST|nr:hypothetical protein [Candidatus Kuenenia stuttgartiensis]MBE7545809.1 hypothetical protein [Planctomycetia bacterium]QII13802.1 hypothetical protein KsCSTR_44230 [Candidatus Kuenenia stuttgartiensis]SOH05070.1 hypothetical protein KSMBR1_2583 [Candidatus Kuenenia stuttgartiensis]